jgi:hypothetical protein
MSDMNNFDEFLNARLSKQSSEVPSRVWENIVAERNKRKPTGFWLTFLNNKNMLLLTGLLLAGGAGITILSTPTNMSSSKNISSSLGTATLNKIPNSNKSITDIRSYNKTSGLPEYTSGSIVTNDKTHAQLSPNNINSDNSVSLTALNSTNNNSTNNEVTVKDLSKASAANHKQKRYFVGTTENVDIVKADAINSRQADNYNKNENNSSAVTASIITKHTSRHHIIKSNSNDYVANNETDDNSTIVNGNKKTINYFSNQYYLSNRLQDSAQKISVPQITIQQSISSKLHLPECPTVEKDIAGNKQYIEAYISPDYGIRSLSDTSNSTYLKQRKQSTSFHSAFSIGVRYTKVFKSGISLGGGLNYSQINEKLTYGTRVVERPLDNNGNVIRTDTITVYNTSINRYHSVDIPVLFGYELGNDKIHININAGPVANLYSWQHGSVLGKDSIPQSISTGKTSSLAYQYRTNIGLGVTGGVSVFYKLNDQLHVYAEPYFRYNFGDMTTNEAPIQQKYTTIGLHLGLRIDLK